MAYLELKPECADALAELRAANEHLGVAYTRRYRVPLADVFDYFQADGEEKRAIRRVQKECTDVEMYTLNDLMTRAEVDGYMAGKTRGKTRGH